MASSTFLDFFSVVEKDVKHRLESRSTCSPQSPRFDSRIEGSCIDSSPKLKEYKSIGAIVNSPSLQKSETPISFLENSPRNSPVLKVCVRNQPVSLIDAGRAKFSRSVNHISVQLLETGKTLHRWTPRLPEYNPFCVDGCPVRDGDELEISEDGQAPRGRVKSWWRQLELNIPLPLAVAGSMPPLASMLAAWTTAATKSLSAAVSIAPGAIPLALSSIAPTSFDDAAETVLSTHVGIFSLTSAVMFIGSIRGLNKHETAEQGCLLGILATALGLLSVLVSPGFGGMHLRFLCVFVAAAAIGLFAARNVSMEEMPQLVAIFHSFVGLAAVFVGFANFFHPGVMTFTKGLETIIGVGLGSLTFTGSVVAAGKLHGVIAGRPIIIPQRWTLNIGGASTSLLLTLLFCGPLAGSPFWSTQCLLANTVIFGFLGANMVLPIGGADMPIVVSLLNAFSGLATSATGFMLSNNLLTISGALIASSGTLLSDIMCRGINRSLVNVLLGGFGTDGGTVVDGSAVVGDYTEISHGGFVDLLVEARRVVIVPGYGMAVARCQGRVAEIVQLLRNRGVVVHFAIHPVAGRLPGHMNVLLAEANIPYDIVREMEDVNPEIDRYDVAIVVGANDIVNPATQTDTTSPIYGMPAIEVWKAKRCIVLKRSMATGYSGVDNPLFYIQDTVRMLFGDATQSLNTVFAQLEMRRDQIGGGTGNGSSAEETTQQLREENYPTPTKFVGVIKERKEGETRVSITPTLIPKIRKMGFNLILETGAGLLAGYPDEEYGKMGGVRVVASAMEVFQQADIMIKVNEPSIGEAQMLREGQTFISFWSMYQAEDISAALARTGAISINLALVPRVSRAQKLDALTSMANIAGYRAVLEAFSRLPKFSRSSVTAGGTIPPSKVFIIGAGVAGLSAIATAHALGAKVYANDVRSAAKEQVESMGAEFIEIDSVDMIAGEGAGGYAQEMGQAFADAQLATYARIIPQCDVVISTAMIPNRASPVVITEEMVRSMKRGSIIVDLAAAAGGNCALTQVNEAVVDAQSGVVIIGETNFPAKMAAQSSDMIAANFTAMLDTLGGAEDFGGDHWEDAVVKPAIVARNREVVWGTAPPPAPAPPPAGSPVQSPGPTPLAEMTQAPGEVPEQVSGLLAWLEEHKQEVAMGLGAGVLLTLGLGTDIPVEEVTHIGYFVLSLLIGHFTVASVTPALHTPLISVTNAISGIIVVGGMLQLQGPVVSAKVVCALLAVFFSSINIVGGFAVTQRMLEMFRKD